MLLWLTKDQANQLIQHAQSQQPMEVCGLIAGHKGEVKKITAIENVAANPDKTYKLDPEQQVQALINFEHDHLDLIAIYHSHPTTAPIPSQTDIRNAAYPDTAHLIISLQKQTPSLAAWEIRGLEVTPVELVISDNRPTFSEPETLSTAQKTAIILAALVAAAILISVSLYLLPPAPTIPGS